MKDLHDRLSIIAGSPGETSARQADADVTRGRRALRRRRTIQGAGTSVFAVAALAAVVAYGTGDRAATPPPPQAAPPTAASAPAAAVTTRLVAYHGEQPHGFTVDKVPAGWEVQGVNEAVLTIAPIGLKDRDVNSFVGKIAVMLQSKDDKRTPAGTKVTVAGKPGVISVPEGGGDTRNLWVEQPDGIWLQVQIWDARTWSDDSIVEFGAGLHVTKDAVRGVG